MVKRQASEDHGGAASQVPPAHQAADSSVLLSAGPAGDSTKREFAENEVIKQRVQLEELVAERTFKLEHVRASLEEAQAVAHLGSWEWDVVTDKITGSEEFYRLFGVGPEGIAHLSQFNDLLHPGDLVRVQMDIADALSQRRPYDTDYRIMLSGGGLRYVNARGQAHVDSDGKPLRMIGTCIDITERKQAEEALRESEGRLRQLANSLPQLVWTCQPDGPCDFLSQQWIDFTGISEELQLGFGWLDQVHPDDREATVAAWNAVMASGDDFHAEFRIRRHDGEYRWFDTRAMRMRDSTGATVKWFGSNTDITERKRDVEALAAVNEELLASNEEIRATNEELRATNEELEATYQDLELASAEVRRSEDKYRTLTENLPQMIFVKDRVSVYIYGNSRYVAEFGLAPEQIAGKTDFDLYPAELADKYRADDQRIMDEGRTVEIEEPYVKDGQVLWVKTVKTPVRDAAGVVTGIQGIFWDITERKRAEEALISSEQRFRLAAESLSDVIYEWDLKDTVTWFGDVDRLLGYLPGEYSRALAGWVNALHPEDKDRVWQAVEQQLKGADPYDVEYRIQGKGGAWYWWSARGAVLRDGHGMPVKWVGSVSDITDRKRAEEEVRQLNAELEQRVEARTAQLAEANSELEAFAHSVSHDLRAPLRGIDGWSMALLEDYADKLDAQGREYLDRVRAETQRMGHLIDDMLKLSRVSRATMQTGQVDLSAMALVIADRLARGQPERHVEFVIQSGLSVEGDSKLLEIALENLLDNAWKFTGKTDSARIEVGAINNLGQEDRVFFVRDNGAGFDMAYEDKLFKPFQRLHRVSDFPGTGIGLVTTQRILRRHGGKVWVEAQVDHGATFYFSL